MQLTYRSDGTTSTNTIIYPLTVPMERHKPIQSFTHISFRWNDINQYNHLPIYRSDGTKLINTIIYPHIVSLMKKLM